MNFFVLAPLTAAITNLLLGIFVLSQRPRSTLNRVFFAFSLTLAWWNAGILAIFFQESREAALQTARLLHFGIIFTPFLFIHLVFLILKKRIRKYYYLIYLAPVILSVSNLTDLFISDVTYSGYSYYGIGGYGYNIFTTFIFLIVLGFVIIAVRSRKVSGEFEQKKISYLTWALSVLTVCGLHDMLPIYGVYHYPYTRILVYPLGTIGSIIYGLLIAYSVLQYNVLNIHSNLGRLAATLSRLVFLCFFFFLTLLICTLFLPDHFNPISFFAPIFIFLITLLVGTIFFPKLIGMGEEYLEHKLLGDNFEYHDKIKRFTNEILFYSKEEHLFSDLNQILTYSYQFKSFYLFILNGQSTSFALLHGSHADYNLRAFNLPFESPIVAFFNERKGGLTSLYNDDTFLDITSLPRDHKASLAELDAKLCFPLRGGGELLGLLMVGDRIAERPITHLDLTLLIEMTGKLGLFINQSRLRKQVALAQELELLGNLSRGLAHDLNNLITPISTYWQLAQDSGSGGGEESMRDFAVIARKNLEAMKSYIQKALFFSTNHEPQLRRSNVPVILKDIQTICQPRLAGKNIALTISCPDPLEMIFDEVLIERLFSNLILNAIDASPEDSRIDLTVMPLNRSLLSRKSVRFCVQDYGSGIPEEEIEKVFTPYFTTKDTGDNKRGPGLGLAICRRVVDLHQGTINIHSQVGVGTRVEVDLPADLPLSKTISTSEPVQL